MTLPWLALILYVITFCEILIYYPEGKRLPSTYECQDYEAAARWRAILYSIPKVESKNNSGPKGLIETSFNVCQSQAIDSYNIFYQMI